MPAEKAAINKILLNCIFGKSSFSEIRIECGADGGRNGSICGDVAG
jgi:hypothetical protein